MTWASFLWRSILLLAVMGVLAAFGYFVWPTPYRYHHFEWEGGISVPLREHRITGKMELFLLREGWVETGKKGISTSDQKLTPYKDWKERGK